MIVVCGSKFVSLERDEARGSGSKDKPTTDEASVAGPYMF
jgi:hypothetical protein